MTTQRFIAVDEVLSLFGKKTGIARKNYAAFVADGIDQGPRSELVDGGLRRSQAGSLQHLAISVDEQMTSDERILGEGNFVASVLQEAEDHMTACQRYQLASFGLEQLTTALSQELSISQTAVSQLVRRGEALAVERGWKLSEQIKL